MSEETITINVDEYQRLKKIRDAANFVIGFVSGALETDRTNKLDMAEIRAQLGVTQQVMAEILGVDRKYVSMVETGVKPLSKKLAAKLGQVANIQSHTRETSTDFRDTLESVKGRLERAIDNE